MPASGNLEPLSHRYSYSARCRDPSAPDSVSSGLRPGLRARRFIVGERRTTLRQSAPRATLARKDAQLRRVSMRIAVVGAGGVGGGFGAALAKAGADVTFIARGAHLAAMKSAGLKVSGPRGDTHLVPTKATDDPTGIGAVDIVLFCVKLWDVESAGEQIKPLIGPDTGVIPLQNGIDAAERLIPILGPGAVMGGVAQISASITAPGVITQVGTFMRMIFGEFDGKRSKRAEDFLALCLQAGFDATLSEQILTELWMKFILLASNAGIMALARQPIGRLRMK